MHDPVSWVVALIVLVCVGFLVILLARRPDPPDLQLVAPGAAGRPHRCRDGGRRARLVVGTALLLTENVQRQHRALVTAGWPSVSP